ASLDSMPDRLFACLHSLGHCQWEDNSQLLHILSTRSPFCRPVSLINCKRGQFECITLRAAPGPQKYEQSGTVRLVVPIVCRVHNQLCSINEANRQPFHGTPRHLPVSIAAQYHFIRKTNK